MFSGTVVRIGISVLATFVVLLSVVASGFTQDTAEAASKAFLPMVQQGNDSVEPQQSDDSVEAAGFWNGKVRPSVVLVHGAWADGTGWQEVIKRLESDGYAVTAVQNPLFSLANDVATTKRVIDAQTGPVIVVGHSYGGAVISGAAAGNPNVKALVYIAAFALDVGETGFDLLTQYPTALGTALVPDAAGFLYIDRAKFRTVFAADVDRTTAGVMAATQKPVFNGIFGETVTAAAWKTIPSWYMVATEDQALSPDMERFLAQRMNATTVEIKSSHVPFISHPQEVVKLIKEAAKATTQ